MKTKALIGMMAMVLNALPGLCLAASFTNAFVFSENRQYSSHYSFAPGSYWDGGAGNPSLIHQMMQVGGDTDRVWGTVVPAADVRTRVGASPMASEPQDINFQGNSGGMRNGYASGFSWDQIGGGPHQPPDSWENKTFRLTLYTDPAKTAVAHTVDVVTAGGFQALTIPTATVAPGPGDDILHPTITWASVPGASYYRILVLNINCRDGLPVVYNPLHISDNIPAGTTSYTIPASVNAFMDGRPHAIWVQARQTDGPQTINRSSFFTLYSAYISGLGSQDLTSGWSLGSSPPGAPTANLSFAATADNLNIAAAITTVNQEYFGRWKKTVTDLRGLIATLNVSGATGDSFVGVRKTVAQLANGNHLRAEMRLQYYAGVRFGRYRVREYQQDTGTELRIVAQGNVGDWNMNTDTILGLALVGNDIVFFTKGLNGFCMPILVPIDGDFTPMAGEAELITDVYPYTEQEKSSITAAAKNVKFILAGQVPPPPVDGDINGDGQIGLPDAIHALQVTAGTRE